MDAKKIKASMKMLVFGFLLIVCFQHTAFAQAADTTSADGIEFTEIKDTQTDTPVKAVAAIVQAPVSKDTVAAVKTDKKAAKGEEQQSLWGIFIAGFVGGLAALLMPCIFPMLPLTVSFFTKGSEKGKAFGRAALYGFFIIIIYVVLGLLVTVIFGADALNSLSTNGIFNFFFFLLLVAFGASFLGAFEITLPSSWVNKMDANSDKGGIAGL
ncbi:MAG TPA: hypothetical protein VNZ46_24755, partial [Pedobacter sp.]|nr:hypothetical protein [Pedobacter sp.]